MLLIDKQQYKRHVREMILSEDIRYHLTLTFREGTPDEIAQDLTRKAIRNLENKIERNNVLKGHHLKGFGAAERQFNGTIHYHLLICMGDLRMPDFPEMYDKCERATHFIRNEGFANDHGWLLQKVEKGSEERLVDYDLKDLLEGRSEGGNILDNLAFIGNGEIVFGYSSRKRVVSPTIRRQPRKFVKVGGKAVVPPISFSRTTDIPGVVMSYPWSQPTESMQQCEKQSRICQKSDEINSEMAIKNEIGALVTTEKTKAENCGDPENPHIESPSRLMTTYSYFIGYLIVLTCLLGGHFDLANLHINKRAGLLTKMRKSTFSRVDVGKADVVAKFCRHFLRRKSVFGVAN